MIAHYIETHGYQPPPALLDAVSSCPEPSQPAYHDALRGFAGVRGYSDEEWNLFLDMHRARVSGA